MNQNIFRPKYYVVCIHTFFVFALVLVLTRGSDINIKPFLAATITLMVVVLIANEYYKTSISDTQIKSYDAWGRRHSIEFNEIVKIKPIQFVFMKYIRVMGKDERRPVWIPLFLRDLKGFYLTLEEQLPSDNVLLKYLNEYINHDA